MDVYAFGIVLYELISAKEAIVRSTESTDAKGLVYLVCAKSTFDSQYCTPDIQNTRTMSLLGTSQCQLECAHN